MAERKPSSKPPRDRKSGPRAVTPRTGGRSARVVAAVLEAALEELTVRGYGALSIEAVAERAGVAKTTVYRRWPTRSALVSAAFAAERDKGPRLPDEGSLVADLTAYYFELVCWKATDRGKAIHRVLLLESDDPELVELVGRLREERRRSALELVERARARGESTAALDVDYLLDAIGSLMHFRTTLVARPMSRDDVTVVVARSLVAAAADVSALVAPRSGPKAPRAKSRSR